MHDYNIMPPHTKNNGGRGIHNFRMDCSYYSRLSGPSHHTISFIQETFHRNGPVVTPGNDKEEDNSEEEAIAAPQANILSWWVISLYNQQACTPAIYEQPNVTFNLYP